MKQHFESYLEKCDWPEGASIDYVSFKHLLRFFIERRRRLLKQAAENNVYIAMDESITTKITVIENMPSSIIHDSILTTHPAFQQQLLEQTAAATTTAQPSTSKTILQQEQDEFLTFLQYEIQKACDFYKDYLQRTYDCLISTSSLAEASDSLLQAALYHATTMITVRQIMIRYNAFQRTFAYTISTTEEEHDWHSYLFTCGTNHNDDHQDGNNAKHHPNSIYDTFQWHEISQLQFVMSQQYGTDAFTDSLLQELEQVLSQSELILQKSMTTGENNNTWRDFFLLKSKLIRNYILFGLLQSKMSGSWMMGRHLKMELRAIAKLCKQRTKRNQQQNGDDTTLPELHPSNRFPLFLNLLSCFLFMMNNYIIEPSSAYYANALGSSDALSGLMIGGAAWFAIASAVVYSYWTNSCYKPPIVFAGVLMIVGNLLYGAAGAYNSMTMCLIGRALTGLGAPRVINRRYVADATPFHLRTLASAGFCLATAFGSALGPGVAIVLDATPVFAVSFLGRDYEWNGMTAPGYFMSILWSLYTVTILLTFQEPVRSGLVELQERERRQQKQVQDTLLVVDEMGKSEDDETDVMDDYHSVGSLSMHDSHHLLRDVPRNDRMFSCCCPHITHAVALTMSLIFMKRIALESIVGSTSVITKNRYGWSIQNVGTLHLVNGILVIPVSALAGWLSTLYEDRFLASVFLGVTLTGMLVMVDYADLSGGAAFEEETNLGYQSNNAWSVGPVKYIIGSLVAFSGIEACESYVASMMSKVVPSALAVGTFNSGLLATLVGTGGRAAGDLFITLMGLISIRQLLNLLIIPGLALVAISILLIRANYKLLGV